MIRVWLARKHPMYGFFWQLRKLGLIKVMPCDGQRKVRFTSDKHSRT